MLSNWICVRNCLNYIFLLQLLWLPCALSQSNDHDIEVEEESPVATVIQNAADFIKAQQYVNSETTYKIFGEGPLENVLKIDPKTAVLTVNGRVDREKLCPKSNHPSSSDSRYPMYEIFCIKPINILITSNGKPTKILLKIKISDINDHTPQWKDSILRGQFVENTETQHITPPIPLKPAIDEDAGENGRLKYFFQERNEFGNGNVPFKIEEKDSILYLSPTSRLDREHVANYSFYIYASDNGKPERTGSVLVKITIEDMNDQTPTFNESIYHYPGTLPENTKVGTNVLRLKATDKDIGKHGEVVYEMSPTASELIKKYFEVHSDGRVTVRHELDYDRGSHGNMFKFDVIAKDSASYPYQKSSTAKVEIKIGDVNDEKPNIEIHFIHKDPVDNLPYIKESQPKTTIGYVTLNDPDFSGTDRIGCELNNSNFQLSPNNDMRNIREFTLEANQEFDRERSKFQYLKITCKDSAMNEDSKIYKIKIKDINDNAPEFDREFTVRIRENNRENAQIDGFIKANDPDEGENAELTYRVAHEFSRNFSIDNRTGQLIAKVSFDREQKELYTIKVLAIDKGKPPRTGTGTVKVTIEDENDWPPQFDKSHYSFEVNENGAQAIGQVHATDKDIGRNQIISYYLLDSHHTFKIDSNNGKISAVRSLDREAKSIHVFHVIAKNTLSSLRRAATDSATATVTVQVLDQNDEAPMFLIPNATKSHFELESKSPIGSSAFKAIATDPDEGENGRVSYKIVGHEGLEYFTIDQESGGVYLSKKISGKMAESVSFKLSACDNGKKVRCSTSTSVRVIFTNKMSRFNEKSPDGREMSGNEPIIIGLAVIFIILVAASVILFCLIRRKSFYINKHQKHTVSQSEHQHDISLHPDHMKRDPNMAYEVDSLLVKQGGGYLGSIDELDSDIPKKKQLYATQMSGMTTSTMLRRGSEPGMNMAERAASPEYQTLDNLQATYRARQLQAQYSIGGPRYIVDPSHTYYEIKHDGMEPGNAMPLHTRHTTQTLNRTPRPPPRADYGTHVFRPIASISQEKEAMLQSANELNDSGAYPVGELMQSSAYQFETSMRTLDRPQKQGKYTYDAYKEASFV